MRTIINTIIPNTIDDLLDGWEMTENDRYRLTVLHKNNDALYCFLSGNLQEIKDGEKIDLGMSIALSKKTKIAIHYDALFKKIDKGDGFYYSFEEDNPIEKETRVIPFMFHNEPPSLIINKDITHKLLDALQNESQYRLNCLEYMGENGLIKTLVYYFKKGFQAKEKEITETKKLIKKDLVELLKEEGSPSRLMKKIEYYSPYSKNKVLFAKEEAWPILIKLVCNAPLMSLIPFSAGKVYLSQIRQNYETKFNRTKEEEAKAMMSEFFIAHPKAQRALIKIFESYKHFANVSTYIGSLAITNLMYNHTPSIISYPLIALNAASAVTIATNLAISKGRDSSGIISSVLERKILPKLE